jgi:hypothetical protein
MRGHPFIHSSSVENVDLRRSLGCPPDDIHVHACSEPDNRFDVIFHIRMFQKRLRITQDMICEFIAGGA